MVEPLSTAAGVIGITAFAIESIQSLTTFIRSIQQVPKTVKQTGNDLNGIESAISSPTKAFNNAAIIAAPLKNTVNDIRLAEIINNCGESWDVFQTTSAK